MPRSTRNRSVSPQKTSSQTSNDKTNDESKEMERDRLCYQIQEMFKDSVEPDVVHLVLTECEWRVDEAIETLFAMNQDDVPEKKGESKVSDLDVIACSLIGNADSHQQNTNTHSLTATRRETTELDQSTVQATLHTLDEKTTTDKESLSNDVSGEIADDMSEPSESAGVSDAGLQSYMAMYNIYGTYIPEIMESINLKDEHLLTGLSGISLPVVFGSDKALISSSASGISEITLRNDPTDVTKGESCIQHDGKVVTCHVDRRCVIDTEVLDQHTAGEISSGHRNSLHCEGEMSKKTSIWDFECLAGEKENRAEDSENISKGGNSDPPAHYDQDNTRGNERNMGGKDKTEHDLDTDVCANVQEMFASYRSVQSRLEKDATDKAASELPAVNLSPEAPVFVPRIFSSSSANPPRPPPGIDTNNIPHWFTQPPPGAMPMFMAPKGPRPVSQLPPRFGSYRHPNPQRSQWQRPSSNFSPFHGPPRPLQPLSGVYAASQKPFRFTSSGSQGYPPPPSSSERFPTMTDNPTIPQTGPQSSAYTSYSKAAASEELLLVPEWAKMSSSKSTESESDVEITYETQVKKVRSYVDQGRPLMVLLRGLPGSGKSYLAREIVLDGETLSTDDYFYRCGEYNYQQEQLSDAHNWNKARARDAMDRGVNPVVIDNTNTMEWEMIPYVRLAVARGYSVEVLEPNTPWRFQPKALCKKNSHGVNRETIRKMNQRYQHHVTAAAMLAKVAQQQSIQESRKQREESPSTQPLSDLNASVKLVEYESSSDEEKIINKPEVKKGVFPPKPIPVKSNKLPGPPTIPKLNLSKNQPQKANQNNSSIAPTSPRKHRRKKRRVSSSKSEVIQAIEEILQTCEGQIEVEDWTAREDEIQALLFMSPVSDTEKQEIQVWLKGKLDTLKGRTDDKAVENHIENKLVRDLQTEDTVHADVAQDIDIEFQKTSFQGLSSCSSNLTIELDTVKCVDLTDMMEVVTSMISAAADGKERENVNLFQTALNSENDGNNDDIKDNPWSQNQSGPKPKRDRKQRTIQNQHAESFEQIKVDPDKQLEKELEYWNRNIKSEDTDELGLQLKSCEIDCVDVMDRENVTFSWEDPKPQREQTDSDKVSTSSSAEGSETADSLQREDTPDVIIETETIIQKIDQLGNLCEVLEVFTEDINLQATATEDKKGNLGESKLQFTSEDADVAEKSVKEERSATFMNTPQIPEIVKERNVSDCTQVLDEPEDVEVAAEISDDVQAERKLVEVDDAEVDKEESEDEEFKSFDHVDSADSQDQFTDIDDQGPLSGQQLLIEGSQPVEAEDSFLSLASSEEGEYSPEKSDLSFASDEGEKKIHKEHIVTNMLGLDSEEIFDHDSVEKMLNVKNGSNINPNQNEPELTIELKQESSKHTDDFNFDNMEVCDQKVQCDVHPDLSVQPDSPIIDGVSNDIKEKTGNTDAIEIVADGQVVNPNTAADTTTSSIVVSSINIDTSLQKCSTPKKSKSGRKRQGKTESAFLDDQVRHKVQSENWSSFGITTQLNTSELKQDCFSNISPKLKRHSSFKRTFTNWQDFKFLEQVNSLMPLSRIKDSEKYKVLLGKSRDINLEKTLRKKRHSQSPQSNEDNKKHSVLTLEKGCMTDENDLQVPDDVEFLVSTFPDAEENHLREALGMCQGNVEWTVNLLLDWGASQPFSSTEKEEISNEMKLINENSPEKIMRSPEHKPGKSPLALFDLCRRSVEVYNLADIDQLQKQVIKTGHQRLQRMESHSYERAHSLSMSESNLELSGNESVLDELCHSSSLAGSDVYISPDKDYDMAASVRSPKGRQLFSPVPANKQQDVCSAFSAESDWVVEDDWSVRERSMIAGEAHVTLPVPIELVHDLEELFGPVQSNLSDCESFEVTLDLRTAKRLFNNLRKKPISRISTIRKSEDAEKALQKQLQDDEALARKLQEELNSGRTQQDVGRAQQDTEDPQLILRDAKAAALLDVHEPIRQRTQRGTRMSVLKVPSSKKWKQGCNLMDIMEEEKANQQRREKQDLLLCPPDATQIRALEATGDHVAISTKLKRQKLYNQFPGVDENFLEEIFEANGFSLEDTVQVLQEALGKGVSPHAKKSGPLKTASDEVKLIEDAKQRSLQDLIDKSWRMQESASKPGYQSWESAGVPEYDDIRGEANIHHKMRNECFQKAQAAFRRGMKEVATFYSEQGHLHTQKLKEANMRASQKILEQRSSTLIQQGTLDLHGFHVEEAIHILKTVMQEREEEFQARPDKRKQSLFVITGRGRHSKGGVAKLRPAIINYLNNVGYRFAEQQPGLFKIQLQYHR